MNDVQFMKSGHLRKRVFESAWQIVENEGIEHLNMRKLAQLSGCSLGSIYNVFGSFQDLQLHINASILTKLYALLNETTERAIQNGCSLPDLFRNVGLAYVEYGQKNRLLWKALFEYFPHESTAEWYVKHTRAGIYQICDRISAAFGLPEAEAKRIVGFFWASTHGMSAIFLNRKMDMVSELFNKNSINSYLDYCLEGLFNKSMVPTCVE